MVSWKTLAKRIPSKVQVHRKKFYEVVWFKEKDDGETVGLMDVSKKQIMVQLGQTSRETVLTYLHELIHAISDERQLGLTESQVQGLEGALYYVLKKDNVFTEGSR